MSLVYSYPGYSVDFTERLLDRCCDMGARLASEVGLVVRHEWFLDQIRGKNGVTIKGNRVHFDEGLLKRNIERYRAGLKHKLERSDKHKPQERPWTLICSGVSMAVIDIETEEIRPATCQDLRELIKLINSFDIGGNYPVMPQDLPPLMRAIACYKICWESSDNIEPHDYLHRRQTPFLYEMYDVMEKPFYLTLCVPQPLILDENDLEIFLDFYPGWKQNRNVRFGILDYPMLGITKPVTMTGSMAIYVANMFSIYTLFNTFDPELEMPLRFHGGLMTDLRHTCWAWGHPRQHLMKFLNSRITPGLARVRMNRYSSGGTPLESSSSAIDEQAAVEKMGIGMLAALQGARNFSYVGSLCVDDLFSGVQFVIDVEIVNYIRETIEAFDPHPDIMSMDDGFYEMLRDVCLGKEEFISHPDTIAKFRNIMPSSDRLVREKLRSWMSHKKTLKDRAKEECIERIRNSKQEFHLSEDKQKALDDIYDRAKKTLLG